MKISTNFFLRVSTNPSKLWIITCYQSTRLGTVTRNSQKWTFPVFPLDGFTLLMRKPTAQQNFTACTVKTIGHTKAGVCISRWTKFPPGCFPPGDNMPSPSLAFFFLSVIFSQDSPLWNSLFSEFSWF